MRHDHVVGIAAAAEDADRLRLGAELFFASEAHPALAAADPRIDQADGADRNGADVRPDRDDFADVLVAEYVGQADAALGHLEHVAATQVVAAMPDVKVRVADAGSANLHQDFGARRYGGRALGRHERLAEFDDFLAVHASGFP